MYEPIYVYVLIRNESTILALPSPTYGNVSYELNALYSQGFIYCCEISAANPVRAVEIFKKNEQLEINTLRREIFRLQTAFHEMQRENDALKRNACWPNESGNSVKYYEIFGFSKFPQPDDLKKRYRSLCQLLHPDKNGDTQLFQLVQQAYLHLSETKIF